MKHLLILPFVLMLAACVDAPKTETPSEQERRFEPIETSEEDGRRIDAICRALTLKEELLPVLASGNTIYTFSYSRKECGDRGASLSKAVPTRISESGGYFVFAPTEASEFGFRDVETASKGALEQICQNTGRLQSPIQTSRQSALWFTSFEAGGECEADANHYCIYLQRGVLTDSETYRIHTREWIKFRITDEKRGFFTERKIVTSTGCSGRATSERSAKLR